MPEHAYAPRPEILDAVKGMCRGDLIEFIDRLLIRSVCWSDALGQVRMEVLRSRLNRDSAAAWAQYEDGLAALRADYPDGLPSAFTAAGAAARLDYLRRSAAANRAADRSFRLNDQLSATYTRPEAPSC
jgi:hypothetical protein